MKNYELRDRRFGGAVVYLCTAVRGASHEPTEEELYGAACSGAVGHSGAGLQLALHEHRQAAGAG